MAVEMHLKVGFCQRITVNRPQHGFPALNSGRESVFFKFHNGGWMVNHPTSPAAVRRGNEVGPHCTASTAPNWRYEV
jgi:hypothetical protein